MEKEQPMRIYSRNSTLNAAARGDKVILVPADSNDMSQHWFMDDSTTGNLTDDKGSKGFVLVNRATGQAMVNMAESGEVELTPYGGHVAVELPKLWSWVEQGPGGFCRVTVLTDLFYSLNALDGNDKVVTVLWTFSPPINDNSLWRIVPINEQ